MDEKLFCVSNWNDYGLVYARDPLQALQKRYGRSDYYQVLHQDLTDFTIVNAICAEYTGKLESILEECTNDFDRVYLLNNSPNTKFFSFDHLSL
ncbi:conserved hypothetical protein [Vibrio crassostreae]|uniref:Uncharacterized protein n=1 Tax=Vibrio crassostreae TaxID=246167 RepID=A0A822MPK1_9VIBR|nr:hypothetical protein [Vibrio crassostreae]MDH5950388.1 hypothetical protein [Vibrio crassostreae]TCN06173.1 hypothetical protein EDB35_114152 [Vibrio crassostreae]TCU05417.1 hypothetical protein EDB32_1164 [Vibrio crassostreae]CAK1770765.1 conserved hypothetical protein [Vibrio crassostreae]CAK1777810.1 conserved hypothetical protein [Vibrio crassostreae]